MRTIWTICLMGLFFWTSGSTVYAKDVAPAEETSKTEYETVIMDDADILSDQEEADLLQDMKAIASYGNVVFCSTSLKKSEDYQKYAQDTYYQLYKNEPGVLFQIDMGNRKLTLSSSTGFDELIKNQRDSIIDNINEMASEEAYYQCASQCYEQIYRVLHGDEIAQKMKHINDAIFALLFGFLLNFILVFWSVRSKVDKDKVLGEMITATEIKDVVIKEGKLRKSPISSGSSSGGSSGGSSFGGFSGGGSSGGSSGGFSGGSSSRGF